MNEHILPINAFDIASCPIIFTCYGMGCGIGLFVTDRKKRLSAGAHIPFPTSFRTGEFVNASRIIDEMLGSLTLLGSDLNCLITKATHGNKIYDGETNIGEQNSRVILKQLMEIEGFITGKTDGENQSRTARFNTETGELKIFMGTN